MQTVRLLDARAELDPIEEMRLRTWARRHYAPSTERDSSWHPVILDEMQRKDGEQGR
jgi:hypothetical protein